MKVLAGSANPRFATRLAEELAAKLAGVENREFPDGETYVRLTESVAGEDVVIVQSTHPSVKLVELLLLQEAAREGGAASVTTVMPYYAYARQDQIFKSGEVVSAAVLARVIGAGTDRVITVDPHKDHVLGFFPVEAIGVSAVEEIAGYLADAQPDVVLAPDKGALDRAETCARFLGCESDYLEKTRLSGTEVVVKPKALDVSGKRVAILDDIISTGGTIATAVKELRTQGARSILAACTHGLFVNQAVERLRQAGCDAVLATDTLEGPTSSISAAPAVARALREAPSADPVARASRAPRS